MKLTLHIWRQNKPTDKGGFVTCSSVAGLFVIGEANGELWKFTRSVKISGTGKASGDIRLERSLATDRNDIEAGPWVPENEGDAKETQRKIQELAGPPALYLATKYGAQDDIARLLDMKPKELKDILQQASNTELFVLRHQIAKGIAAKAPDHP